MLTRMELRYYSQKDTAEPDSCRYCLLEISLGEAVEADSSQISEFSSMRPGYHLTFGVSSAAVSAQRRKASNE